MLLGELRQKDDQFEISLSYSETLSVCFHTPNKLKSKTKFDSIGNYWLTLCHQPPHPRFRSHMQRNEQSHSDKQVFERDAHCFDVQCMSVVAYFSSLGGVTLSSGLSPAPPLFLILVESFSSCAKNL